MNSEKDFANVVCTFFKVEMKDLYGITRKRQIAEARQILWLLLYRSGMTYHSIGDKFNRSECTVLSGIRNIKNLIDIKDKNILSFFESIGVKV